MNSSRRRSVLLLATLGLTTFAEGQSLQIKDDDSIVFLGDSITAQGWTSPGGYVRLVVEGLRANGVTIAPHPAGIGGHTSRNMLQRIDKALAPKPTWITISCGVNDVWRPVANGVALDVFKETVKAMVEKSQAAGVKVILLTATPIGEKLDNEKNLRLSEYNDYLRELAKEKNCLLADTSAAFHTALKDAGEQKGNRFTVDGVHMNLAGNVLMATAVLEGMGMNADQIARAREAWLDYPGGATIEMKFPGNPKKDEPAILGRAVITLRQLEQLKPKAADQKANSVAHLFTKFFQSEVKAVLKPNGPYDDVSAIFAQGKNEEVQTAIQARLDAYVKSLLEAKAP